MILCAALLTTPVVGSEAASSTPSQAQQDPAQATPETWLDRSHRSLHGLVWRTARMIDGWMGPPLDDEVYQEANGSAALAVLWDEYDGFDTKERFRVDLPLPRINQRLRLFVGRVNRDEYVTERNAPSGAFPRWTGSGYEEDQTLAGLVYSRPERSGSSWSVSGGARLRSAQLDGYVKVSYRYRHLVSEDTLLTLKETVFYQASEKFGLTSRLDLDHILTDDWALRWTGSATVSQGTEGVRGFSTLTATRPFPGRRALIMRLGIEADTRAEVVLKEYGVNVGYRQSVIRDWLVMELRTSLTWPKRWSSETRTASWGVGLGCEVYFGGKEFSSQPVTF